MIDKSVLLRPFGMVAAVMIGLAPTPKLSAEEARPVSASAVQIDLSAASERFDSAMGRLLLQIGAFPDREEFLREGYMRAYHGILDDYRVAMNSGVSDLEAAAMIEELILQIEGYVQQIGSIIGELRQQDDYSARLNVIANRFNFAYSEASIGIARLFFDDGLRELFGARLTEIIKRFDAIYDSSVLGRDWQLVDLDEYEVLVNQLLVELGGLNSEVRLAEQEMWRRMGYIRRLQDSIRTINI